MFRLALLLFTVLFLTGCVTSKPDIAPWYFTPPRDNSSVLYGVGEGFDANEAKKMALAHIAENLSVSVQSHYVKSDASVRENGRENTLQEARHTITTKAASLRFGTVSIENEQVIKGRVYLLLSVERAALYAEQQRELDAAIETHQRQFQTMQTLSRLEQFVILHRFHEDSERLRNYIALLNAIDFGRQQRHYNEWMERYETAYLEARNTLSLQFISDANSQGFQDAMAKELSDLGIKTANDAADGTVAIRSYGKQEFLLGFYIEKCFLHVELLNDKKSVIAVKEDVITGKSKVDFSQSHHNCVAKFALKAAEEGIFKSLGI